MWIISSLFSKNFIEEVEYTVALSIDSANFILRLYTGARSLEPDVQIVIHPARSFEPLNTCLLPVFSSTVSHCIEYISSSAFIKGSLYHSLIYFIELEREDLQVFLYMLANSH